MHDQRGPSREMLIAAAALWEADHPDDSAGRPIWIYNISDGGVAFRTQRAVNMGAAHYLRLAAGPLKLETRLRLIWCHRRDDTLFEVGAEFVA